MVLGSIPPVKVVFRSAVVHSPWPLLLGEYGILYWFVEIVENETQHASVTTGCTFKQHGVALILFEVTLVCAGEVTDMKYFEPWLDTQE